MHRFCLPPENFRGNYVVSDDAELINQLTKVLRARHGDKFLIFNGSESEFTSQLVELGKREVKFLVIDQKLGSREPIRHVTLYQSILKSDKFDWLIQKAVELGASKIVPVVSRHCIVKDITPAKRKRYEDIIKEATEQCGGVRLAQLSPVMDFDAAIDEAGKQAGAKIIAYEKETEYDIGDTATDFVQLFIGPEGGYSSEEIEAAKNRQIVPVTLGKRILRAETAAVAALAKLL